MLTGKPKHLIVPLMVFWVPCDLLQTQQKPFTRRHSTRVMQQFMAKMAPDTLHFHLANLCSNFNMMNLTTDWPFVCPKLSPRTVIVIVLAKQ